MMSDVSFRLQEAVDYMRLCYCAWFAWLLNTDEDDYDLEADAKELAGLLTALDAKESQHGERV